MGEVSGFVAGGHDTTKCGKCGGDYTPYASKYNINDMCLPCRKKAAQTLKRLNDERREYKSNKKKEAVKMHSKAQQKKARGGKNNPTENGRRKCEDSFRSIQLSIW